jgi:hypothetical protein
MAWVWGSVPKARRTLALASSTTRPRLPAAPTPSQSDHTIGDNLSPAF